MASSTSSSRAWTTTWLVAAALVLGALASYETGLARAGYRASVAMNEDLWAWHRARAGDAGRPVVLLGASRMLLNIDMPTMRAHYPGRGVYMLALNGRYPLAAVAHFARDESFRGTLIVSLNAQALEPWNWDMQGDYVRYFERDSSFYRSFDAWLNSQLQSLLRFTQPELSLRQLADYYDKHGAFRPRAHTQRASDLSIRADFSQSDHKVWQRHFHKRRVADLEQHPPTPPEAWHAQAAALGELVARLEARGGEVILVRMPTSHGLLEVENAHYPRAAYWDHLARAGGAQSIHFADYPEMRALYLPDASHLDYRDREIFTQALVKAIDGQRSRGGE